MLTVKNNFEPSRFFQLKFLARAKNTICTSQVHDCDRRCFVGPLGFAFGLQTAPRVKKN
jgi:hypothetical protein